MDEAIKSFKIERGRIKKAVTDFNKVLDNLILSRPIDTQNYLKLEDRIERVKPKLSEFESINFEICNKLDNELEDELESFENFYYDVIGKAKDLMREYEQNNSSQVEPSTTSSAAQSVSSLQGAEIRQNVKLPNISLPTFDGRAEQWLDFRDLFIALVHEDALLNDAQKLYYLRGSLDGDAKNVVQGIKTSAENYSIVWDCLRERYENTRLLIHNHLSAIYNIDAIKTACPKQLRNILDKVNINLRALESLNEPVDQWDTLLIFLLLKKLDYHTVREWEIATQSENNPSMESFRNFLRARADILESIGHKSTPRIKFENNSTTKNRNKSFKVSTKGNTNVKCYLCSKEHLIYYCPDFLSLNTEDRIKKVGELNLCKNCLRPGHGPNNCASIGCRVCKFKHNVLLHKERSSGARTNSEPEPPTVTEGQNLVMHAAKADVNMYQPRVLLATALANAKATSGRYQKVRVLLDNGSQVNLINESTAKRLGVKIQYEQNEIGGIGESVATIKGSCKITLKSMLSEFEILLNCLVLPEISSNLPQFEINQNLFTIPNDIAMADPDFSKSQPIDVLLGASHFFSILCSNVRQLGRNLPTLTETKFGWIVSGIVPTINLKKSVNRCHMTHEIHEFLTKFWEIENTPTNQINSDEEIFAEEHFTNNVTRNSDGRFVVAIPFKDSLEKLGNSQTIAQRRFLSLERRLQTKADMRDTYTTFMKEYRDLMHMSVLTSSVANFPHYVLPHHGVINNSSLTTKLRVVFDGSQATDSGIARNEIECVGPVVQSDLFSILIRFRGHKIAISADIVKMYRQILVRPEDRNMQLIYWRDSPSDALQLYKLNTVTYGTSSGSFLATRCLLEVANIIKDIDYNLHTIIKNDIYVDDILTGADSIDEANILCKNLNLTLNKFGFPLQKWNSNAPEILNSMSCVGIDKEHVPFGSHEPTKTLGVYWHPKKDTFGYSVSSKNDNEIVTKRIILSSIGQIFDPLGLVGASIILPKILLQKLWEHKLDWDSPVPDQFKNKWLKFKESLPYLNKIEIPRAVLVDAADVELHGFADASESAYGACIYLRSPTAQGTYTSSLICAKSKVAPIKTLTIPRLELCAALILSKLADKVLSSFRFSVRRIYLWTDSEIVLCWLRKSPNQLKTFVANRVTQINNLTNKYEWGHVSSAENPADLISRGIMPADLINCKLWWNGPRWLTEESNLWPRIKSEKTFADELPEVRQIREKTMLIDDCDNNVINFDRFSNYRRLLNTVGYVLRFINACKTRKRSLSLALSAAELEKSRIYLIKTTQSAAFRNEINDLIKNGHVKTTSKLTILCPFLDNIGILRVTGRLQNSSLNTESKHQIILPEMHSFTRLLFSYEHVRLGHAGPQLLLNSIRESYWPLHGKSLARKTIRKCMICVKIKPKNVIPIMGSLPAARVTPAPPFNTSGVDYAGPFIIKDRKGRGCKTSKCYVCLFICFATKAVHIELVSDLTTQAFIAAFRRFASRRGVPQTVWSDNGTNFVGANNELKAIVNALCKDEIDEAVAIQKVKWNFIPSNSPHFGGLWESGIRGAKFHLKRVIGKQVLTFEEMYTVCCQIEAILNSRPITLLTNDSTNPLPLTPGHFLIGRNITSLPDERLEEVPTLRLSKYQLMQQMIQHFWRRWSNEYLHTLQTRPKWNAATPPLLIGDVVLIKNDNTIPMEWPMGRILELHPGKDNVSRVATVKTSKGQLRRAVHKLYRLPVNEDVCRTNVPPRPGACSVD